MSNQDIREKLIAAFKLGNIYAIGGMVFDANHNYVFSTSELADLRRDPELNFRRVDAGGRPTWQVATESEDA
jgi:hypothetical protein